MIPFYNTSAKGFGHMNPTAIMDKVDTFSRLVLPIGDILIGIVPVGTVARNHVNLYNNLLALVLGSYGVTHAKVTGTE